jgi:hypothetical protein
MTLHDTESERVGRIGDALLAYLERHPDAADTLDGISLWWLAHDESPSRADLACALDKLVAEERLHKYTSPEGSCLFRKRHAV